MPSLESMEKQMVTFTNVLMHLGQGRSCPGFSPCLGASPPLSGDFPIHRGSPVGPELCHTLDSYHRLCLASGRERVGFRVLPGPVKVVKHVKWNVEGLRFQLLVVAFQLSGGLVGGVSPAAITPINRHCDEITRQQVAIDKRQDVLIDQITRRKLKTLATQRDQILS